jgi:precorrin-6B methylase 2
MSVFVAGALAQEAPAANGQFQPTVGQPGKDVVWVPTPQALVDKMLDMAKATPQDYLMDLGSGDGRTVITAAKRGIRALGVEYNADLVELSKRSAAAEKVNDKATFVKADLFETDFSQATVITMFLLPAINLKLRPKILDLKPGTRIVSNSFTMGDWAADETATVEGGCTNYCTALLWIVPAKVDGTWKSAQGEVRITQSFQALSGTVNSGGNRTPITNGKMVGDQITFTAGNSQYTGRVRGNAIEGTVRTGANSANWRAAK